MIHFYRWDEGRIKKGRRKEREGTEQKWGKEGKEKSKTLEKYIKMFFKLYKTLGDYDFKSSTIYVSLIPTIISCLTSRGNNQHDFLILNLNISSKIGLLGLE